MYKQLSFILMFMLLGNVAFSQIGNPPNSNSGTNVATVNIILKDFQSIFVTGGQDVINLVYDTPQKYQDGVTSLQAEHLNIFSTQDYVVGAAVWQENLITQNDISVNGTLLNRQFKNIHQGDAGSRKVDVEYSAKGNNEYLTKTKQTYTTQVVYMIEPR